MAVKEFCDRCGVEVTAEVPYDKRSTIKEYLIAGMVRKKYLWWNISRWEESVHHGLLCPKCFKALESIWHKFMNMLDE